MWNYSEKVMDHFLNPRNVGEIVAADGVGEVGNIVCGDAMKLYIKLSADKQHIEQVGFQTFGCASAIASASALTEMLRGKSLVEAAALTNQDIAHYLGELPEEKMHCSVMGMEAFQAAMHDIRKKYPELNLPGSENDQAGEDRIVCQCFSISERKIKEVALHNHLTTVEQITHYCKAGGACGGCKGEIQSILDKLNGKAAAAAPPATERPAAGVPLTNLQKMRLVQETFDEVIRPGLMNDGGDAELVDIDGNTVYVRLRGRCAGCPSATQTLKHWVEAKLRERVSTALTVEEVKG
jgi:NifU-like protein